MNIKNIIEEKLSEVILNVFQLKDITLEVQENKTEFEGDFTIVTFPLVKQLKKKPELIGVELGEALTEQTDLLESFNVVKGFLNIKIRNQFFVDNFTSAYNDFDTVESKNATVMVEYSSPNTNKPLHLGHVRNNLLGFSVAQILKEAGYDVIKTQIINDRGIHICKSMLAWEKFGKNETPESTNTKGDHFVGKYYVEFDKELKNQTNIIFNDFRINKFDQFDTPKKEEVKALNEKINTLEAKRKELLQTVDLSELSALHEEFEKQFEEALNNDSLISAVPKKVEEIISKKNKEENISDEKELETIKSQTKVFQNIFKEVLEVEGKLEAEKSNLKEICKPVTEIMKEAQQMLLDWENGDEKVRNLWNEMNSWVYKGFNETYNRLGVDFDQVQYESNTYILGKDLIQEGLDKEVLYQKEDGSVWCDLTDEGLDQKLLLRSDGTSVYMTQDLGTAVERFKQNDIQKLIYTVGNEQDYHFQVLFKILGKLGYSWADQLYHLSYGMVELPNGKMKSREGTVVDADDLMQEMYKEAKAITTELGKLEGLTDEEKEASYEIIGQAALKYFMLKVDPKKKMLFNPDESVEFAGNTGPFVLYTYARIQSVLSKAHFEFKATSDLVLNEYEKELIMLLANYKGTVEKAAELLSPAFIANYVYDLVKSYNSFYQSNPIISQEDENLKQFRLNLSDLTAKTIKKSLGLLGIKTVNRM
ncbi:arginine--tRNA ligase [Chryseobacterium gambrini]|uniref:Arginine--tRNA ligase n=1 Tax=Chryseobacterium gambrini TaxID=373672 RepID=A0AAJ1R375_9FLAO|nr:MULTISPECIES: arginine--tRNA ligase [Chryseobacterium]MDN4013121.1 arginine--tRNA ligase [Chryseobacterium gambrini]MDN4029991.1 arginine--tRNA ligase [Chryseobacterium gambrini]QWA40524.1 arginine--tRNA ligase [Chryseobacterium sp. ZHDP1]